MKTKRFLLALIWIGTAFTHLSLSAAERLASVFGDNMVLQRDRAVPIWGWTEKGQAIKVTFAGQEKTATADENGRWMVRLDPMPANKNPQELKITGATTRVVKEVVVGEKKGLDPVKEVAGGKLKWVSIAGEDKKFFWAEAAIDGQTLVVSRKEVPKPVAVRYAFTMNPEGAGLYNKDGLPASPFRTDAW